MTHQQHVLCFLAALPAVLALGIYLGHLVLRRCLTASVRGTNRPTIGWGKKSFRVVTEREYLWLHSLGKLERE